MAERVLQSALMDAGLQDQVVVDSAGTRGYHLGEGAHKHTDKVLAENGYRGGHHKAREFTRPLFSDADLVILMDRGHRADLNQVGFTDPSKIVMWRSFDPSASARGELDVPDPWGLPHEAYEEVLAMLEAGIPGLIGHIRTLIS